MRDFAFQPPLLMNGAWTAIAIAFVSALVGISALSAAVAGHMFTALSWPHRLFLIAGSLAAISPHAGVSVACSAVLIVYVLWDARRGRRAALVHRDEVNRRVEDWIEDEMRRLDTASRQMPDARRQQ